MTHFEGSGKYIQFEFYNRSFQFSEEFANAHVAFTYLVIQMKVEFNDANLQETEKYQVKVLFKQKAQIKIKPLKTKERGRVTLNAKCYEESKCFIK